MKNYKLIRSRLKSYYRKQEKQPRKIKRIKQRIFKKHTRNFKGHITITNRLFKSLNLLSTLKQGIPQGTLDHIKSQMPRQLIANIGSGPNMSHRLFEVLAMGSPKVMIVDTENRISKEDIERALGSRMTKPISELYKGVEIKTIPPEFIDFANTIEMMNGSSIIIPKLNPDDQAKGLTEYKGLGPPQSPMTKNKKYNPNNNNI